MSKRFGFDLRSIIQDIKKVPNNFNIDQVALQIHIALEYNPAKYAIGYNKTQNRLMNICESLYRYRKISNMKF